MNKRTYFNLVFLRQELNLRILSRFADAILRHTQSAKRSAADRNALGGTACSARTSDTYRQLERAARTHTRCEIDAVARRSVIFGTDLGLSPNWPQQ